MSIDAADIAAITGKVTKDWANQRRAEERRYRTASSRSSYLCRSTRVNFTDVAGEILPTAYNHASGNGRLPVSKRQLFYACREAFRKRTGRQLEYNYFAGTLLVKYMNCNPSSTASWKITADPRGTLVIPNAHQAVRVPCGTLPIDDHMRAKTLGSYAGLAAQLPKQWPSLEGGQRFKAVLYIEKEGFEQLLQQERIAERYELAVLSCKGQSVVAARKYVDHTCRAAGGVPLFVVHDFDKYGFDISQRLTSVSYEAEEADRVTYRFQNDINVTDLGLRLEHVEQYDLPYEEHPFKGDWPADTICTRAEREYLESGRRVELNAFTSPQFIDWLETMLKAHGMEEKLVPADSILEQAYRRAVAVRHMNNAALKVAEEARELSRASRIPADLRQRVAEMANEQDRQWDLVLHDIVAEEIDEE